MNPNVVVSPITLHLVGSDEDYDYYPRVGVVARATITVSADPDGWSGVTELCVLEVESRGVWGIECPDLVPGGPIPEDSWVLTDHGDCQIDEARAAIRALLPGHPIPIPTPTEED